MVVLGGVTRLTESGLSITDWRPVTGILPPMSEEGWQNEFNKYIDSPEFIKRNYHFTLIHFKGIFWLEYLHRLLGRLVGFAFLIPMLVFWLRGDFTRRFALKMGGVFLLGGLQGLIGWLMVKSGLVDQPYVSPYRLALHLSVALLIYSLMFWQGLRVYAFGRNSTNTLNNGNNKIINSNIPIYVILILAVQILLGAFIAGMDGGLVYNTYPKMNGQWIPEGIWAIQLGWRNLFENIALVQFLHRTNAVVFIGLVLWGWWQTRQVPRHPVHYAFKTLLILSISQFLLGIFTLISHVPVVLGALHQAMAVLLLTFSLFIAVQTYGNVPKTDALPRM